VEDAVRYVEPEGAEPPHHAVGGIRQVYDGAREVVQENASQVPRVSQRSIQKDGVTVVEKKRAVERVLIEERRGRAGEQTERGP